MGQDSSVLLHYLAPLQCRLEPSDVSELVVNRPGEIGVERPSGWEWIDVPELTPSWLTTLARAAAAYTSQDVSSEAPICSTLLPMGERCQIVLPPAAEHLSLTVRKPSTISLDLEAFVHEGMFEHVADGAGELSRVEQDLLRLREARDWPGFFRLAVSAKRNILISGATGSGKTTFAKGLVRLIPPHERLVTIEDTRELDVPHRNVVHLLYAKDGHGLSKVGPKSLLESALRMRPDRILLQELRDGAAFFYLRNITGHPGSITTIHADGAALAFEQLALLIKESDAGRDLSRQDIGSILRQLVDVVVQMRRADGRFRISEIYYEPLRKRALAG